LGCVLLSGVALAQVTEARLKAAFVFNFIKFVEWPASALAATPGKLNLCLLGSRDASIDALHELNGKAVKNRSLSVRAVPRGESLMGCQVLVMAESEPDQFEVVLKRLEGEPVLTVNGSARFLDAGGMIALELKGGYSAGVRFMDNLHLVTRAVSLGDCESLAQHPASMTHSTYTPEERAHHGISEGLVRLSVGLETVEDLLADIRQALAG
jgi:hypothetical protein